MSELYNAMTNVALVYLAAGLTILLFVKPPKKQIYPEKYINLLRTPSDLEQMDINNKRRGYHG